MLKNKEKGFTLIELLAVVGILSLVFLLITINVNNLFDDSNKTIDETSKNMVLDASKDYALEFRKTENWYEELSEDGTVNFCISLESLINHGYFKNNNEKIIKYKDEYVVKVSVVNGVYDYNFIKIKDLDDDDICKYYRKNSEIISEEQPNIDITEEGTKIGSLEYDLNKIDNISYQMIFDLNINLSYTEVSNNNNIYIPFILDSSGSMDKNDRFINAKAATIDFSERMTNELVNSKIALIQYTSYPHLRRNFQHAALTDSNIKKYTGGDTNTSGGVDLATSLMYREEIKKGGPTQIYVILLYDGQPTRHSELCYENTSNTPTSNATCSNNENISMLTVNDLDSEQKKKYYFENFLVVSNNRDESTVDASLFIYSPPRPEDKNTEKDLASLIKSSEYLKELTGATLIVIGYDFGVIKPPTELKTIATIDEDLCGDSDHNNYCYYDSDSANIDKLFDKLLEKILTRNTNAIASRIVVEPKKINGEDAITISQNGKKISGNKITKIVEFPETNDTKDYTASLYGAYELTINDSLFEDCNEQQCMLNDDLFDIYVELIYPDDITIKVEIEDPVFDITITKTDTLN